MFRSDVEYLEQINTAMLQEEHDSFTRLDNIELNEIVVNQVEGNLLTIMLPTEFELMPLEQIRQKYLAEDRPQVVLSDPSTTVNFTFSFVQDSLYNDSVEEYRAWAKELLQQMNPNTIFFEEGLIESPYEKNIAYMTSKISCKCAGREGTGEEIATDCGDEVTVWKGK